VLARWRGTARAVNLPVHVTLTPETELDMQNAIAIRQRNRLLAALAALCLALPAGVFVYEAVSGDAPAPVSIAKKGSFDITE
jgi:hypothetical protein